MPEIAEVARIVHFLRLKLVGKRIGQVAAVDDANVFGKAGTTAAAVENALRGKKVVSSGSQGKYFWITLDSPPHLVMHFGMTGWIHIKGETTAYANYYKKLSAEDIDRWPPRFCKFHLTTVGNPSLDLAFTDARRFGRVRLVDCPWSDIRKHSPLVENGPDPVVDPDIFTEDYLKRKMRSRRVPVKSFLLDQAVISGIGNWVADETLYQAKLHPEQYCEDLDDDEIRTLYHSIRHVCQTAVDKLGDSDQFPKEWLFHHRWGKGNRASPTKHACSGEKLAFITVGGRTSCYAPRVQTKKTGRILAGARTGSAQNAKGPVVRKKVEMSRKADNMADIEAGNVGPSAKKMRANTALMKDEAGLEIAGYPRRRRSARLSTASSRS